MHAVKTEEVQFLGPIFNMPYFATTHFIGRQAVLDQLKLCYARTHQPMRAKRAAIWGMSGVGKTQTIMKYGFDNREMYDYVFFLRATNEKFLGEDITIAVDTLRLLSSEDDVEKRKTAKKKGNEGALNCGGISKLGSSFDEMVANLRRRARNRSNSQVPPANWKWPYPVHDSQPDNSSLARSGV